MEDSPKYFRWPAYNVVVFVYGGLIVLVSLGGTIPWWLPNSNSSMRIVQLLVGAVILIWGVLLTLTTIGAIYGYWQDAKTLKKRDIQAMPLFWIVAHLLVGPFAAIYYLYRRGKKVGNDCSGLWIAVFPDFTEGDEWTFLRV